MTLGNVRGAIPIHGFITTTNHWQLTSSGADRSSAWATSRLEFYRQPAWMKQWPFAHTIEMTYRLSDGVLEVATVDRQPERRADAGGGGLPSLLPAHGLDAATTGRSRSVRARAGSSPRTRCRPARPSRSSGSFPTRRPPALRDFDLDDDFSDLVRDANGRATMTLRGKVAAPRRGVRAELPGGGRVGAQAGTPADPSATSSASSRWRP